MTRYQRSDYGKNPNAGRSRNNAQARGWGSGWPDCQWDKFVVVATAGVRISCRREIAPLFKALFERTEKMGYNIRAAGDGRCGGTWGVACRSIRGTNKASNHSWGLAVDINAPCNPMSNTFISDIPPKVVSMWEKCDFYWGGRYSPRHDPMHFEYLGKPSDVDESLSKVPGGGSTIKPKPPPTKPPPKKSWQEEIIDKMDVIDLRRVDPRNAGTYVRSHEVLHLQGLLLAHGYGPRGITGTNKRPDGIGGPYTKRYVDAWQRKTKTGNSNGTADSIVGPKTWRELLR